MLQRRPPETQFPANSATAPTTLPTILNHQPLVRIDRGRQPPPVAANHAPLFGLEIHAADVKALRLVALLPVRTRAAIPHRRRAPLSLVRERHDGAAHARGRVVPVLRERGLLQPHEQRDRVPHARHAERPRGAVGRRLEGDLRLRGLRARRVRVAQAAELRGGAEVRLGFDGLNVGLHGLGVRAAGEVDVDGAAGVLEDAEREGGGREEEEAGQEGEELRSHCAGPLVECRFLGLVRTYRSLDLAWSVVFVVDGFVVYIWVRWLNA
ncbi:hypothetical protein B0J12DRAFT_41267 [Macrophomina phaseolina]|uniref:Uncharacterized protein n=1 Tax=Macrophomina phaseolina TaxID=35725 RepID=A0ABQ8GZ29_9PEZI|nr:hypothetical protein B0J12DRAFT_41267 [Macrophomina phaseolina]